MKKSITFIIIIIFILKGFWDSQFAPVSSEKNLRVFSIQRGESVNDIADRLQKAGLIKSSLAFKVALKLKKGPAHIEAGDFKLSPSIPVSQMITILGKGSLDEQITIIEGLRIEEIAQKLEQQFKIDRKDFLKEAKEGYMFPDTYSFNKDATGLDIATVMKNTFTQKYDNKLQKEIEAKGLTVKEGVILASIVEREGRSEEVRTKVAGILLKRLKIGMGLDADATIQYALGYQPQEKSWWKRNLIDEDKQVDSAYNTYLHVGLPPGPICSPGLSSLQAVANADLSTPYLYYYHDSKGNSYYARTLEEHNQNVANHP